MLALLFVLFSFILVALGVICWNLRQIAEGLALIAASMQIDTMKKAGIVDEIREAVMRRTQERRIG
jgi:hypothetical protein